MIQIRILLELFLEIIDGFLFFFTARCSLEPDEMTGRIDPIDVWEVKYYIR